MPRTAALLGIAVLVVLAATPASAQFCPDIEVLDAASGLPVDAVTGRIVDLLIFVDVLPDPTSLDNLQLALITPNGRRYTTMACTVDGTMAAPGCPVIPILKAGARATWDATFRVPVAGTDIVQSALYGTWTMVPTLDGGAADCPGPFEFTLSEPLPPSAIFTDGFETATVDAWSSVVP